jgi:ribonuclease P protein component
VVCVSIAPRDAVTHEKNVSAEQSASKANTRIPCPNGDARRAQSAEAASGEGPETPDGVGAAEAAGVSERSSASFPKRARLRKRDEFLRVQRVGRRNHTEHFVVLRAPGLGSTGRIGITVSTRVGNAVVRNRIKRLVREIVRGAWRGLQPPDDIVVIAKPGAAQTTHANAAQQLGRALGLDGV